MDADLLVPTVGPNVDPLQRAQAAERLGYNIDHFRTRVESELVKAVAVALHDDLLRYQSRVKRATESLEPTGDTPRLGPNISPIRKN